MPARGGVSSSAGEGISGAISADPAPRRTCGFGPDALQRALSGIHPHCVLSGGEPRRTPWCHESPPDQPAGFYAVARGECWVQASGRTDEFHLRRGDLLFVARGFPHRLCGDPGPAGRRRARGPGRAGERQGGGRARREGGVETRLVRGDLGFPEREDALLMAHLPSVVRLAQGGEPRAPWLAAAFESLAEALAGGAPGAQRMADLLAGLVVHQAVRSCAVLAPQGEGGALSALADPALGPALEALHARLGEPWSVASLAREAGLSRSLFALRFSAMVGVPPMRYLLECRMRSAARQLRGGRDGLKEIARRTGYSSGPAFSSAFRRWSGRPPGAYRTSPPPSGARPRPDVGA